MASLTSPRPAGTESPDQALSADKGEGPARAQGRTERSPAGAPTSYPGSEARPPFPYGGGGALTDVAGTAAEAMTRTVYGLCGTQPLASTLSACPPCPAALDTPVVGVQGGVSGAKG